MASQDSPPSGPPGWPSDLVPTEVFWDIAFYLPDRKDLASMRLVNREFRMKVTGFFMKQAVVNFGSEQCRKCEEHEEHNGDGKSFNMATIISNSYLFKEFGSYTRSLGIAMELSEAELASPNVDSLSRAFLRSCGLPKDLLPRRKTLTPLDKMTNAMAALPGIDPILTSAINIEELALSCDAALGYLQSPDVNPYQPQGRLPIFGKQSTAQLTKDTSAKIRFTKPYMMEVLGRKLVKAGVPLHELPHRIYKILFEANANVLEEHRRRAPLPLDPNRYFLDVTRPFRTDVLVRLQPDQLAKYQKWYLHRHLMAQSNLVDSFVGGIAQHGKMFTKLKKLIIARIPTCLLGYLCADDFWESLSNIEEVSLGVIPDWRTVNLDDPQDVRQVYPADSVRAVGQLLRVLRKFPNIKRFHFEWICGGEFAAGIAHRNRHILPAPFIESHRRVFDSEAYNLLVLPHVTHLSLKNCWFGPVVFYRLIDTMVKEHSLTNLELESVSLTGPPPTADVIDLLMPLHSMQMPASFNGDPQQMDTIRVPRIWSWGDVIDHLSPAQTVVETVTSVAHPAFADRYKKGNKIKKMVFKSCGYVWVPDQRFVTYRRFNLLQYNGVFGQSKKVAEQLRVLRIESIEQLTQVSTDRHLASIIDILEPLELTAFNRVYGFQAGWEGLYDAATIKAAARDGVMIPGLGRFSGVVEADPIYVAADDDQLEDMLPLDVSNNDYDDDAGLENLMRRIEAANHYNLPPPIV